MLCYHILEKEALRLFSKLPFRYTVYETLRKNKNVNIVL